MPWPVVLGIGILIGGCIGFLVALLLVAAAEVDRDRDQGSLLP